MRAIAVFLCAATLAASAAGRDLAVELVNASIRSVVVEAPPGQSREYIDVGERKHVVLGGQQWLRLEMEAFRYSFERLRPLSKRGAVVLEMRDDACLHLPVQLSPVTVVDGRPSPKAFQSAPTGASISHDEQAVRSSSDA